MLVPALDAFLFSAELGAVSDPLVDDRGVHVLQRIESHAAVLQILVGGREDEARTRCDQIASRISNGEDFAKLARELSDDRESAARGGQFAIYERTVDDQLLKAAAFRSEIGDVSGPIQTPLGWHFLKRVPLDEVDPTFAEPTFVRLRGILLRVDERSDDREGRARARDLADRLYERLRSGEDMGKIAREFDQDPGGKERDGDLGWVHRNQPGLPRELKRACLLRIGDVSEPAPTAAGYLILRREK
jgi:peptidyl-prolyl cis-trans isomerase SurA